MSVYNGGKYLRESIESILSQTMVDFEFIIINDGSTDNTEEIILGYNDHRIVYVKNEINLKLIESLNKGLSLSRGKYIARMDDDDISLPHRFKIQFDYMENNPEIAVTSTGFIVFDEHRSRIMAPEINPEEVKVELLFSNPVRHSAVMIRNDLLKKNKIKYELDYPHSEDYHLWTQIAPLAKIAILPSIAMKCRSHPQSIREKYADEMVNSGNKAKAFLLKKFIPEINENDLQTHYKIFLDFPATDIQEQVGKLFLFWIEKNRENHFFSSSILTDKLKKVFFYTCNSQLRPSFKSMVSYLSSPLADFRVSAWPFLLRFCIKSIFAINRNPSIIPTKEKWFN